MKKYFKLKVKISVAYFVYRMLLRLLVDASHYVYDTVGLLTVVPTSTIQYLRYTPFYKKHNFR